MAMETRTPLDRRMVTREGEVLSYLHTVKMRSGRGGKKVIKKIKVDGRYLTRPLIHFIHSIHHLI